MRKHVIALMMLALVLCVTLPACAESWNATYGFNGDVMPTPWRYVYQLGSAWSGYTFTDMQPFTYTWTDGTGQEIVEKWWIAPESPQVEGIPFCRVASAWNRILVGSASEGDPDNGKSPAQGFLAFTAPLAGSYKFTGDALTYGGTGVPIAANAWARVQSSSDPLWQGTVTWGGAEGEPLAVTATFNFTRQLSTGETVYFGTDVLTGGQFQSHPIWWWMDVERIETNLAKTPAGGTATYSCSSKFNSLYYGPALAVDGDLTTSWYSKREAWGGTDSVTGAVYNYPYAWWAVDWSAPQTFNKVEIYVYPDLNYIPNEFALDMWDGATSAWKQIGYGKKTDNAPRYVFFFDSPITTTRLRYRTEVMDACSSGYYTLTRIAEIKVINSVGLPSLATVTGTVKNSLGQPVKNAQVFFHVLSGSDTLGNWGNVHYVGTPTDASGNYTITVDTAMAPAFQGGNDVCVYAMGQSAPAGDPATIVTRTPVIPVPGTVTTCNVTLPGPTEASTTLGADPISNWLLLCNAQPGTQWATSPTVKGTPALPCNHIDNYQMVFKVPKQYADGRFGKMFVTVDYFDEGISGLDLAMSAVPEDNLTLYYKRGSSRIRKEGTNTWRTQTLVFENGITWDDYWGIPNPDGGTDYGSFALWNIIDGAAPAGVLDNYISKVSVRFDPVWSGITKPSVSFGAVGTAGQHPALRCDDKGLHVRLAPAISGGMSDLGEIIDNVGGTGKSGYKTTGDNRRSVWLDVDNFYLFGVVPDLYVKVDYFDEGTDGIRVIMVAPDGNTVYRDLLKGATNTWKSTTFHFQNVCVNDAFDVKYAPYCTGDIQVYDGGNGDDILGKITVSTSPITEGIPVDTIAAAKELANDTDVIIPAKTVTANFGSFFYIEEDDRSSGIRVNGTTSAIAGQKVTVTGKITKINGESVVIDPSVGAPTSSQELGTLGVTNRSLHGVGLSTAGLWIKVWGQVSAGAGSNNFEITDGSGNSIAVQAPSGYSAPAAGTYISLKGVCGLADPATPVIRVEKIEHIN